MKKFNIADVQKPGQEDFFKALLTGANKENLEKDYATKIILTPEQEEQVVLVRPEYFFNHTDHRVELQRILPYAGYCYSLEHYVDEINFDREVLKSLVRSSFARVIKNDHKFDDELLAIAIDCFFQNTSNVPSLLSERSKAVIFSRLKNVKNNQDFLKFLLSSYYGDKFLSLFSQEEIDTLVQELDFSSVLSSNMVEVGKRLVSSLIKKSFKDALSLVNNDILLEEEQLNIMIEKYPALVVLNKLSIEGNFDVLEKILSKNPELFSFVEFYSCPAIKPTSEKTGKFLKYYYLKHLSMSLINDKIPLPPAIHSYNEKTYESIAQEIHDLIKSTLDKLMSLSGILFEELVILPRDIQKEDLERLVLPFQEDYSLVKKFFETNKEVILSKYKESDVLDLVKKRINEDKGYRGNVFLKLVISNMQISEPVFRECVLVGNKYFLECFALENIKLENYITEILLSKERGVYTYPPISIKDLTPEQVELIVKSDNTSLYRAIVDPNDEIKMAYCLKCSNEAEILNYASKYQMTDDQIGTIKKVKLEKTKEQEERSAKEMAGRSNNFNDIPEKREEASKLAREALEYANGTIESFLDRRDRALILNDGFLDTFLSSENFKDFSWIRLLVKERPVQVFQILKSRKLI